jgi:hypothetical protein
VRPPHVSNGSESASARLAWQSRFASNIGSAVRFEVRPLGAMCGRLRVGKGNLHVAELGRCSHVFGLLARFA